MDAPISACTTLGALTINGVDMHIDGAWNVLDPQQLWLPSAVRGANIVLDGVPGRRDYPWRNDESVYSLQMVIDGVNDVDGIPYADQWEGLELNTEYLYLNVLLGVDDEREMVHASLEMPSGAERFAYVQPRRLTTRPTGTATFLATLEMNVPGGRFEPLGS
jgi:hypothetical protein